MAVDPGTAKLVAAFAEIGFGIAMRLLDRDINHAEMIAQIKQAVAQARDEILSMMQRLELNDLRGDVQAFLLMLSAYDPHSSSGPDPVPSEEQRLREVIDGSTHPLSDLSGLIATEVDTELVFGCVPLYATVVATRALAMVERTRTYGIDDTVDVPPMLADARRLMRIVRRKSDRRFGPIELRRGEPGFAEVGYRFNRRFRLLTMVRVNTQGNPTRPIPQSVADRRAVDMQRAYDAIPGVATIAAFRLRRKRF